MAPRRTWSLEEDQRLIRAISKNAPHGACGPPWSAISREVGKGRTNKDCRKRWYHTLDPNLKRGRWSEDEDTLLRESFAEVGPQWQEIASRTSGRTAEQVAKRWKDVLSPGLTLDLPWTPQEDELLRRVFEEIGPKWTAMSDAFPGRNGIACRNRFRRLKSSMSERGSLAETSSPSDNLNGESNVDDAGRHDPSTGSHGYISSRSDFCAPSSTKETNALPICSRTVSVLSQTDKPENILSQPVPSQTSAASESSGSALDNLLAWDASAGISSTSLPVLRESGDDIFDAWLESHLMPNTPLQPMSQWHLPDDPPAPTQLQPPLNHISTLGEAETAPINNVWALLLALEKGVEPLVLSSSLVRKLMADASHS